MLFFFFLCRVKLFRILFKVFMAPSVLCTFKPRVAQSSSFIEDKNPCPNKLLYKLLERFLKFLKCLWLIEARQKKGRRRGKWIYFQRLCTESLTCQEIALLFSFVKALCSTTTRVAASCAPSLHCSVQEWALGDSSMEKGDMIWEIFIPCLFPALVLGFFSLLYLAVLPQGS